MQFSEAAGAFRDVKGQNMRIKNSWACAFHDTPPRSTRIALMPIALLFIVTLLQTGCSTSHIQRARAHYYQQDYESATAALDEIPDGDKNLVLALMERGMINHTRGDFKAANDDWIEANEQIKALDYISISEGVTSLVINDTTKTYSGAPFERSLMHAFTAQNYFALGLWHEAAVEARLIADGLDVLDKFPDDAYSHYLAGLAFEMIRDSDSSRIEYSKANTLSKHLTVDDHSGSIIWTTTNQVETVTANNGDSEFICLVSIGRAPSNGRVPSENRTWGRNPLAEIRYNGTTLGRSYTLNTTAHLMSETQRRIAAIKAVKTVSRIVIKESLAQSVSEHDAFLGDILRLILYAFEVPDSRNWGTLPMWLQVARVPCPSDMKEVTIIFRTDTGKEITRQTIPTPQANKDGKRISLIRIW
jgi:tetratricopeptide (TPR) repeat protein